MQPQQQERLKKMIRASSILSDKEKEEWSDLLIVMNDKQVAELESILNAEAPAVEAAPLTHISNLPSGITQSPTAPIASAVPRPPQPPKYPLPRPPRPDRLKQWENRLQRTLAEKELSRPAAELSLPQHGSPDQPRPTAPRPVPMPKPARPVNADVRPPKRQVPVPAPASVPHPVSGPMGGTKVVELTELADIAKLNLATMRSLDGTLSGILKQMVAKSNYFEVLFYLEKSPLYQQYLVTGRQALGSAGGGFAGSSSDQTALTKDEFEEFSDLLKAIQVG